VEHSDTRGLPDEPNSRGSRSVEVEIGAEHGSEDEGGYAQGDREKCDYEDIDHDPPPCYFSGNRRRPTGGECRRGASAGVTAITKSSIPADFYLLAPRPTALMAAAFSIESERRAARSGTPAFASTRIELDDEVRFHLHGVGYFAELRDARQFCRHLRVVDLEIVRHVALGQRDCLEHHGELL